MYWAWEIKNTWQVHCEYMAKIQYFLNTFTMSQDSSMYSQCTYHVFLISNTECMLMGHIAATWSSTFWIFSQLTELENCKYIVQCILKELSMFWFRKVLVFWTWNHHVLRIYCLHTGGFVPSVKSNWKEHCRVINTLTATVITLEQHVEDVQKKAFPRVGEGQLGYLDVTYTFLLFRLLLHSLVSRLIHHLIIQWSVLLSVVNMPLKELVLFVDHLIIESNVRRHNPPALRWFCTCTWVVGTCTSY